MPIVWKTGNLLDSGADILVNTVNCYGIMGKGIALQIKTKYPWVMNNYSIACRKQTLLPGKLLWDSRPGAPLICHIATKNHWRDPSKLEWIENGLSELKQQLLRMDAAKTVALPRPGCGNGGLNWENQVKPLVIKYLGYLAQEIWVY